MFYYSFSNNADFVSKCAPNYCRHWFVLLVRTNFEFFEDFGEPQEFRSTNKDYFRSGFDRGHMAAAGNQKFNADAMQKTFVLSNIAPQVSINIYFTVII